MTSAGSDVAGLAICKQGCGVGRDKAEGPVIDGRVVLVVLHVSLGYSQLTTILPCAVGKGV